MRWIQLIKTLPILAGMLGIGVRSIVADASAVQALWQEYARDPDRHPNIPNNSYAGYRYGEEPPPDLPVVARVTDHGADGSDSLDDTEAFRKALAAAGSKGGAVLAPAGTYLLSAPLFIHDSGVVLRGEGPDQTILHFTKPLLESYGRNRSGSKSRWSWSGGMVWIAPRSLRPIEFPGEENWTEGWKPGPVLAAVRDPARRGDTSITVDRTDGFTPGQQVVLELTEPGDASFLSHLCGAVPGTADYDWKTKSAALFRNPNWIWPVEITRVEGNRLHLRQPLRTDLRMEWKPNIRSLPGLVRNSGVEHLAIRMQPARLSAHLQNPGWNGIYFENAWDCWARGVVVRDVDNGIGTAASKCITIDQFTVTGRDTHHATFCREQSHDTLWTRFTINNRWIHHGINVECLASGNVWSSGEMTHGTFDSHRALPFDAIRTDIRIHNAGSQGGADDAGPLFGARFAHWNVEILNGRTHMVNAPNMMPRGAVVGVRGAPVEPKPYPDFAGDLQTLVVDAPAPVDPPNLHLAQLALRTGKPPAHLARPITLRASRTGPDYALLEWSDPLPAPRAYELSRQAAGKDWEALANLPAGTREHRDCGLEPGLTYRYRIRHSGSDEASWSAQVSIENRPHPLGPVAWESRPEGIALSWNPPAEREGKVRIERTVDHATPVWETQVGDHPLTRTNWLDSSVGPSMRYRYRLTVVNASGSSRPVEIAAFTRAAGTLSVTEPFTTPTPQPLPWRGAWASWQWTGQNRDKAPSLQPGGSPLTPDSPGGELAWPITPGGARSFFHTTDLVGDFSQTGAEVRFDCQVGRSGPSAHTVALCFRLSDGSWVASKPGYTEALMKWHRMSFVLDQLNWMAFDPVNVAVGAALKEKPDLSRVTGFGIYITRPINNRAIQFDNLELWGVGLRGL